MAPFKTRSKASTTDHGAVLSPEKYTIFSAIEQQMDDLNKIGEDLWRYREPAGSESKSHTLLTKFLKKRGFKISEHYMNIKNSFRATFGEGKPGYAEHPNVGFLCQYNASETNGHNKGHNLVTVVSLTAAIGMQPIIQRSKTPIGQITVIGIAEDSQGTGKMTMLEEGGFKGVDFLMTAYPSNYTNLSPRYVGCRSHQITFKGRTKKPKDQPWEVANPVNAVVLAYQNIATIREQFLKDWSVKSVITSGGTSADAVAESASMKFLLKAPKPIEVKVLGEMLHRCFEAASVTSGCKFEIETAMKEFLSSISTKKMPQVYRTNAAKMGFTFFNETDDYVEPDGIASVTASIPTLIVHYYCGSSATPGTDKFTRYVGSKECQFMNALQGKCLAMATYDLMTFEDTMREVFEEHQEELVRLYENVDREEDEGKIRDGEDIMESNQD